MDNSQAKPTKLSDRFWMLGWWLFWQGSFVFGNLTGLWNFFWKPAYIFLAFLYRNGVAPLRFLNYGYMPLCESDEQRLAQVSEALEEQEPSERTQIQMYEMLLSICPIYPDFSGKDLLEIGCGHGGGIIWMSKSHPECRSTKGMDLTIVDTLDGRVFQGNAEHNPMPDNSVDVIVNVESSHCYTYQHLYMAEAHRILRPGGYHLLADFRPSGPILERVWTESREAGFELLAVVDITPNVIASLDAQETRMTTSTWYTRLVWLLWQSWWAMPGSGLHRDFINGRFIYNAICWQKPA